MTTHPAIPNVTLNNGVQVPQLRFGVFQVPPEETQRIVEDALEAGYRHIDTAAAYRNEARISASESASVPSKSKSHTECSDMYGIVKPMA